MKKPISLLLCALLLVCLLPATARADVVDYTMDFTAATAQAWAGGKAPATEDCSGAGWSWDVSEKKLTLTGMTFSTTVETAMNVPGGTTIVTTGTNSVTSVYSGANDSKGINCAGSVSFSGAGTLTATGGGGSKSYGIYSTSLTMNNGTVNANGGSVTGESYGVYTENLTMVNGTLNANATSTGTSSYGIKLYGGNFNVADGTVNAVGTAASVGNYAVYMSWSTHIDTSELLILGNTDASGEPTQTVTVDKGTDTVFLIQGSGAAQKVRITVPNPAINYTMDFTATEAQTWAGNIIPASEDCSGTGWSWKYSQKELTLSGLTFSSAAPAAMKLPTGAKVVVTGNNTITSTYSLDFVDTYGIYGVGSITFSGAGTLSATGGTAATHSSFGMHSVDGTVTFDGTGTVNAAGGNAFYEYGISSAGSSGAIVINSGTVNAKAGVITGAGRTAYGLTAKYITINDGQLNVNHEDTDNIVDYGLYSNGGTISFLGGAVNAIGRLFAVQAAASGNINSDGAVMVGNTTYNNYTNLITVKEYTDTLGCYNAADSFQGIAHTVRITVFSYTMDFTTDTAQTWAGGKKPASQDCSGTGWSWDVSDKKLTLSGLNFTTLAATAMKLPVSATVNTTGTNAVTSAFAGNDDSYGIFGAGDLSFTGTGTLSANAGGIEANGKKSAGIGFSDGTLTVSGGTVYANGKKATNIYGVYSAGTNALVMVNGGTLTAATDKGDQFEQGDSCGISAKNVTLYTGALNAAADYNLAGSIGIKTDTLLVVGGTLNAQASNSAVYAANTINAVGATVTGANVSADPMPAAYILTTPAAITPTFCSVFTTSTVDPNPPITGVALIAKIVGAGASAPSFTTQPTAQSGVVGGTATFTAEATGNPTPTYRWQVSTDSGASWNNVTDGTGGTDKSYTTPVLTAAMSGYKYQCVATNYGSPSVPSNTTSNSATLTVAVPTITVSAQPSSPAAMAAGSISGSLSVTATANNSAAISYQWYKNTTSSASGGTLISGATSSSYAIPTTTSAGTLYYYCVLKATGCADVTTNVATVTVNSATLGYTMDFTLTNATWCGLGGVNLTTTDVEDPAQKWSWDASEKTLTLNNYSFVTTAPTAIKLPGNAVINCSGVNAAKSTATVNTSFNSNGVYCGGNLTFNGTGALSADGGTVAYAGCNSYGVCVYGALTVNGGTITATASTATNSSIGLFSGGALTMNGSAMVTGSGNSANNSFGVECGAVIKGTGNGKLTASGATQAIYGTLNTANIRVRAGNNSGDAAMVQAYTTQKWAEISYLPAAVLTGGSSSFTVGSATQDVLFSIGSGISGFNKTNNYDRTLMNGVQLNETTQILVENGSIKVTFLRSYLNTLSVGTHTANVYLKGGYSGVAVPISITVSGVPATPSSSASGRANPSTGFTR